ncbi:excinuclease ABC subunit UvrA [Corynebacterium ammoniagenes]|uniref:UvrABC system protein A n=1 Tax=Corynebacterium ammoniagenes DSM 20306 TaxID=649754 RepID=A0ABN0ADA0_CORAM|nr:excinuclease ABC subunit UvrA [Corynebacterium ammoniagenes]APT82822.1 excinuclease ABC subunit A [Corynebacterium ammoniagenes DSM 20306]AQS73872.1 excinuclease ABC subunit A [Corynebacterium ammoniagenes]EFG80752.1 putative excinuclease ABC, A subunit [Corynebacterium ammoniagenes DSM 20306]
MSNQAPDHIRVRGAKVHNLREVDVDIPLNSLVGIAGVSGSGKSSLALGVLYAEGSRRYIEALSTYTRRRMSQSPRAQVDSVEHVPAALALRQRPAVPGIRSTFGTSTELLNVLRLMFSRLSSHTCPNGHRVEPTISVAAETPFYCPTCGEQVHPPGAEELSFNSSGACPTCEGTGTVRSVDDAALIPDPSKTIDEGAIVPWQMFGFNVQPDIVREFGVRTDVPWNKLREDEKQIVLDGPEEKKHITVSTKKGVHELDFTFRNARLTVTEELKRADTEKRLAKVSRFLHEGTCSECHGTRLSPRARTPVIGEHNLADITAMTLDDALAWSQSVPEHLPADMQRMATGLATTFAEMARRLIELGLGYLSLDRAGSTLSTGERQRVQLARAVRNRTTGVLYVLDEPSIGLHPVNVEGLLGVMRDLLDDGNSVIFVDHDVQVLRAADWLIEIGPGSGKEGGTVIAENIPEKLADSKKSLLAGFLTGEKEAIVRDIVKPDDVFALGAISLRTDTIHTVAALSVDIPLGRLTAITGVSGSGKSTLLMETLVPALHAQSTADAAMPSHVRELHAPDDVKVQVVDATPIGHNVRSTVATYSGVMDQLRKNYAATDTARADGLSASDFSYNTGSLACPRCEGTGEITLDVQFLPDLDIVCPDCDGSRYAPEAAKYLRGDISLPALLQCTVREAMEHTDDLPSVHRKLTKLEELGLGYLTLGEATPALSGGEAQRLKLVSQMNRDQTGTVFVLDEPSVGLHPLDVQTLLGVLDKLTAKGATVIVIEHDLDLIVNADHVIDLGLREDNTGSEIIATGSPADIANNANSLTGKYLAHKLE